MQTNNPEENRSNTEEETSDKPWGCWKTVFFVLFILIAAVVFIFGACFIMIAID